LLAIAQAIRQREHASRGTIAFATWGAEEQGMIGSQFFAAHPPDALPAGKIVQYINLEWSAATTRRPLSRFAKQPSRRLLATRDLRYPNCASGSAAARAARTTRRSVRGIPYLFFWTPDRRCYHEACDTADRIDVPRMADIAQLAGQLAWNLAGSDADLAASRAKLGCGQKD
jgi:hypothetical protein